MQTIIQDKQKPQLKIRINSIQSIFYKRKNSLFQLYIFRYLRNWLLIARQVRYLYSLPINTQADESNKMRKI